MNESPSKTIYDQAETYFHTAQGEFLRPEEDVVSYSVCRNVMQAIHYYLTAFLLENGFHVRPTLDTTTLLAECQKIDPNFKQINLKGFLSVDQIDDVYMDMKTVKSYLDLANKTRVLVLEPKPTATYFS